MSATLEAALSYARRGWRVVALHTPMTTPLPAADAPRPAEPAIPARWCSCGKSACDRIGKHPRYHPKWLPNGVADATTDEAALRRWWTMWPDANVGIATGAASGLVVLDVDSATAWAALLARVGELPATPVVHTPRPGRHVYFAHPGRRLPNSAGALGPGLDVRGDGGYVVAPPSRHATGGEYEWAASPDLPLAAWPAWLIPSPSGRGQGEGLRTRSSAQDPHPNPLPEGEGARGGEGAGETAGAAIPQGQRNDTLFRVATRLARAGISPEGIAAALRAENATRCRPPLDDAEVARIAASAARYAPSDTVSAPRATPLSLESVHPLGIEVVSLQRTLPAHDLSDLFQTTSPDVDWVLKPYLARGFITEIAGKPKLAGKTTLALDMCKAILTGRPFLDEPVSQGGVYYLTEQSATSFRHEAQHAGLAGCDGMRVLLWDDVRGRPWAEVVDLVLEDALARGIRLLIVDTLPQFVGLYGDSENNAGAALQAIEPLKKAVAAGLAVLSIRHERKGGGEVGEAARGSSAFGGAVDTVCALRRPDGQGSDTVRVIHAHSRLPDVPRQLTIDRTDDGYELVDGARPQAERVASRLLDLIPVGRDKAVNMKDLQSLTRLSRPTLQKALHLALDEETICREAPADRTRGYLYWRPAEEEAA